MNQGKLRQFENFNFENNVVWKEYIKDLDPSVPQARIEKLKKIWYKDNIDPDFDIEAKPSNVGSSTSGGGQTNTSGNYQQQGMIKKALFDGENLLKASFIFCAVLQINITWAIGTVICFLALYRQLKTPQWNKKYAQDLFVNEFAHNLLYLCGFLFVNSFKVLYYIPLILHFWIGIAEYLNLRQGSLYNALKKYVDATRAQKADLMNMKLRVEIAIVPITFVLLFLQHASFFGVLFFSNFLRIKYYINDKTKEQCRYVNQKYLEPYKSNPVLGFVINIIQKVCGYLTKQK